MNRRVSVCIPTFNRPDLLLEAMASCFLQTHRPLEIVIGDDSTDDRSEHALATLDVPDGIEIRYHRNTTSSGQSANVNGLFRRATGSFLSLLHDDDLFCPGGLDRLVEALDGFPDAACLYGRQDVIDWDGRLLAERSVFWNRRDRRLPELAGAQASSLRAALWQHVPNDGYLIDTELARSVGYRHESDVGHAVDADFIIEIAKHPGSGRFVFVDEVVSFYRLTPNSLARSSTINREQDTFFMSLLADHRLLEEKEARDSLLKRISEGAALDAALIGRRLRALRIIFSHHYDKPLFSRWTLYRLLCVVYPPLGTRLRHIIKQTYEGR